MSEAVSPADLCRGDGYPPVVREVLEALVDSARRHLEPLGLRSVALCGSAARGEMTWRRGADGGVDLLSDVDAPLFTRRRDPEREARLAADMAALTETHRHNPFFHVDAGVNRAYMKRHTLWTYEFRMSGVALHGEDPRWLMPRVTRESLDRGSLAELVLVRLWNQALHTPARLVRGEESAYERLLFAYLTARNVLELPSILLPHHGVLRPGYAARQEWLRGNQPPDGFGADFVALCERALSVKRDPHADPEPGRRLAELAEGYGRLACHLATLAAGDGRPFTALDDRVDAALGRAFREHPILRWRRRGFELGYRVRQWRAGRSGASVGSDRARMVRCLLALHRALAARLEGEDEAARRHLAAAEGLGAMLGRDAPPLSGAPTWPRRWQALREWLVRTYAAVLYKGNPKNIAHCVSITRWSASS